MSFKGRKLSEEHKRKLSEANKGKHAHLIGREVSEETKAKIAAANSRNKKGTKLPEETKAKMSEAHRARMASLTPEERATRAAKISATKRAKPHVYTEEQKTKMSEGQKRFNASLTPEERARMHLKWTQAGKLAAGQIFNDTSIERFVSGFLCEANITFEHPYRIEPFEVDFYIPAINTVVEVNGCYWHACPICAIEIEDTKGRRMRDRRRYGYLASKGYKLKTIWEHEIKQNDLDRLTKLVEVASSQQAIDTA